MSHKVNRFWRIGSDDLGARCVQVGCDARVHKAREIATAKTPGSQTPSPLMVRCSPRTALAAKSPTLGRRASNHAPRDRKLQNAPAESIWRSAWALCVVRGSAVATARPGIKVVRGTSPLGGMASCIGVGCRSLRIAAAYMTRGAGWSTGEHRCSSDPCREDAVLASVSVEGAHPDRAGSGA